MNVLVKISVRVSLIRVEELYICLPATFLSREGYSKEGRSTRLAKNLKKNLIERQKIAFSRNEVTRSRITEVEGKIRALSASWIFPIYTSPEKRSPREFSRSQLYLQARPDQNRFKIISCLLVIASFVVIDYLLAGFLQYTLFENLGFKFTSSKLNPEVLHSQNLY